ncbi:MAG: hypothetical protein MUP58_01545 [Candidatus Nanohaloarchaeota archaeon QJJ-9]|nr:hypothetical protein [Candidatus Nanohaloarchaeota archaeon QJJ-9]
MSYTTKDSIDKALSRDVTAASYILDNLTHSIEGRSVAEEFLEDIEVYQKYKEGELEDIEVEVVKPDEDSYVKWAGKSQRLDVAIKNLSSTDLSASDKTVEKYLNETFTGEPESDYAEKLLLSLEPDEKEEFASKISKKLKNRRNYKEAQRFDNRWKAMADFQRALKEADIDQAAMIARTNGLGEPYLSFASNLNELYSRKYKKVPEPEEKSDKGKVQDLIGKQLPDDHKSNIGPLGGIERI